ncbi:hypothetical protein [Cellulophaga sp. Z1A5H]|uniref:hypothetical protein n=1 Tax=Cellulophaga sp. Z1A5H TaxID=2687291 RepID=UPI0013FD7508|nr:hypothetical protein [Cellulophaga sp. Z1A5H]
MEGNNINEFDIFLRKAIKEVGTEAPSKDFNSMILSRLPLTQEKLKCTHPPLISNFVWLSIAMGVVALTGFTLMYDENRFVGSTYFEFLNNFRILNVIDSNSIFTPSKIVCYGIISVLVFCYIQIFVLKKYFSIHNYALNQYAK